MSLELSGLEYRLGPKALVAGVSLTLLPGEVVALVGPNGAGKTTLLKLASRTLKPSAGTVRLDGVDAGRLSRLELAKRLAVVAQASALPEDFRVQELVMMGRTPHLGFLARERPADVQVVEAVLSRCDLWPLRERTAGSLSGGERQRVLLARALAQQPRYLLLDEPTTHLDFRYQLDILRLVRQEAARGLGVLAVMHDLSLAARLSDRLLVMQGGRLVAEGTPREVLSPALIADVYGARASVWLEPESQLPVVVPQL